MASPLRNVVNLGFGGGEGGDIGLLEIFAMAIAIQPGINAPALAETVRTTAESREMGAALRLQVLRLADLIDRTHTAWSRGMEELRNEASSSQEEDGNA